MCVTVEGQNMEVLLINKHMPEKHVQAMKQILSSLAKVKSVNKSFTILSLYSSNKGPWF